MTTGNYVDEIADRKLNGPWHPSEIRRILGGSTTCGCGLGFKTAALLAEHLDLTSHKEAAKE